MTENGIEEELMLPDPSDPQAVKEYMWKFFLNAGFSEYAVAGILGNVYVESNKRFDPCAVNSSGYYGLFQWGNGREKDFFEQGKVWARENGLPEDEGWKNVQFQCEYALEDYYNGADGWLDRYVKREDGTILEGTKDNFENAQNTSDTTLAWGISYERCYDGKPEEENGCKVYPRIQHQEERLEMAEAIYNEFANE